MANRSDGEALSAGRLDGILNLLLDTASVNTFDSMWDHPDPSKALHCPQNLKRWDRNVTSMTKMLQGYLHEETADRDAIGKLESREEPHTLKQNFLEKDTAPLPVTKKVNGENHMAIATLTKERLESDEPVTSTVRKTAMHHHVSFNKTYRFSSQKQRERQCREDPKLRLIIEVSSDGEASVSSNLTEDKSEAQKTSTPRLEMSASGKSNDRPEKSSKRRSRLEREVDDSFDNVSIFSSEYQKTVLRVVEDRKPSRSKTAQGLGSFEAISEFQEEFYRSISQDGLQEEITSPFDFMTLTNSSPCPSQQFQKPPSEGPSLKPSRGRAGVQQLKQSGVREKIHRGQSGDAWHKMESNQVKGQSQPALPSKEQSSQRLSRILDAGQEALGKDFSKAAKIQHDKSRRSNARTEGTKNPDTPTTEESTLSMDRSNDVYTLVLPDFGKQPIRGNCRSRKVRNQTTSTEYSRASNNVERRSRKVHGVKGNRRSHSLSTRGRTIPESSTESSSRPDKDVHQQRRDRRSKSVSRHERREQSLIEAENRLVTEKQRQPESALRSSCLQSSLESDQTHFSKGLGSKMRAVTEALSIHIKGK